MSPPAVSLALLLLVVRALAAHSHQQEPSAVSVTQGEDVSRALGRVFTAFGDVASAMYKISFVPDSQQGRGSKMGKMAVPLIIGFKMAGAIVAAMMALKVLVLKSIAFSTLALLAAAGLGLKYVLDKAHHHGGGHHGHHGGALQHVVPYFLPHQDLGWENHGVEVEQVHAESQPHHIEQHHQEHEPVHIPDLQSHYSSQVTQVVSGQPGRVLPAPLAVQPAPAHLHQQQPTSAPTIPNHTSFSFVPSVQVAQRKILKGGPPPYRTKIYKTTYEEND